MNSISHLYVAVHLNEMLNDAANERLARRSASTARTPRVSLASLASATDGALKTVWSLLTGPADRPLSAGGSGQASTVLPSLTNYPYRG